MMASPTKPSTGEFVWSNTSHYFAHTHLRLSHATALGSVTESFYCMERMAVTYPREDTSEPVPTFATKAEWKAARSTKIDAVARLVRHLLRSDDAPPPVVVDGKLTLPPLPPATVVQRTRKILIYQEYSFFTPLLVNVSSSVIRLIRFRSSRPSRFHRFCVYLGLRRSLSTAQ